MCDAMGDMPRNKKMVSFALDPRILARFDAWLASHELPPSKTSVVELALTEFFDKREQQSPRSKA
jgi:hypothetical protein